MVQLFSWLLMLLKKWASSDSTYNPTTEVYPFVLLSSLFDKHCMIISMMISPHNDDIK